MRTLRRGGPYLRVADPDWEQPLSGVYAEQIGGRWNPARSFPVVYLCATVEVARANVYRLLARQPYGPEDLDPESAPVLVRTTVPNGRYADVTTAAGVRAAGLPATYPKEGRGRPVSVARCRPIGVEAYEAGLAGVACRSAAPGAPEAGEELAHFVRGRRLRRTSVMSFEDWFW